MLKEEGGKKPGAMRPYLYFAGYSARYLEVDQGLNFGEKFLTRHGVPWITKVLLLSSKGKSIPPTSLLRGKSTSLDMTSFIFQILMLQMPRVCSWISGSSVR
jgi:hypothetical protein